MNLTIQSILLLTWKNELKPNMQMSCNDSIYKSIYAKHFPFTFAPHPEERQNATEIRLKHALYPHKFYQNVMVLHTTQFNETFPSTCCCEHGKSARSVKWIKL